MTGRASFLVLIVVGLAGATACGSGGKHATSPATPRTPATPTTPSTATSTTFAPGLPGPELPPSTPVNSSTYRNAYLRSAVGAGIPTSLAPAVTDCVIGKLEAQGIKTVGEVKPHQDQFAADVKQCTRQAVGG